MPCFSAPRLTITMPNGAGSLMAVPLTPVTSPPEAIAFCFGPRHEDVIVAIPTMQIIALILYFIRFLHFYACSFLS